MSIRSLTCCARLSSDFLFEEVTVSFSPYLPLFFFFVLQCDSLVLILNCELFSTEGNFIDSICIQLITQPK